MIIELFILAILSIPSITAALSRGDMAGDLITAESEGNLEKTFKKLEKEQDKDNLSDALADVAKDQDHIPMIARCLRVAKIPSQMQSHM
jgi:hypothetical protein